MTYYTMNITKRLIIHNSHPYVFNQTVQLQFKCNLCQFKMHNLNTTKTPKVDFSLEQLDVDFETLFRSSLHKFSTFLCMLLTWNYFYLDNNSWTLLKVRSQWIIICSRLRCDMLTVRYWLLVHGFGTVLTRIAASLSSSRSGTYGYAN